MNNRAKLIGEIDSVLMGLYSTILTPDELGGLLTAAKAYIVEDGGKLELYEKNHATLSILSDEQAREILSLSEALASAEAFAKQREASVLRDSNLFGESIGLITYLYKLLPRKESDDLRQADKRYSDFISKVRGV